MTKQDYAALMAEKTGMTKADSVKAYDAFLEVANELLKKGEKVAYLGFGTFSLQHKDARTARNPRDGKPIKVAAKNVVKFKPGKALSDSVLKVKIKK
ncbi:MAG: HU family DNA-binding protein [Bacteroidales bacterium]|nr:HU family DNA-binding protein [Bacteroidales bacterium]MBQ9311906.1 HU family DNA-binding protein [Bacteroidales bacterium]